MKAKPTRLGQVLELERIPLDVDLDAEYVQIGIRSFGNGIFHRDPVKGSELSKLRYFRVRPDRLIVSNIMAWEGAIAVSGPAEEGCVASSRFLSYCPKGDVNLRYLNYFFQSEEGRGLIKGTSTGTVLRNQTLSIKAFEAIEVPLPDLDEQRRVATRLDATYARIGAIGLLRSRMLRAQAALAESLLASVISDDAPLLPVGELLLADRSSVEIDPDARYRALGLRSFGRGTIRYATVPGSELSKLRFFRFPSGALVLSNIKAWEGAIGVTAPEDTECVASNRFLFYLPRDSRVNVSYIRHYLLTKSGLADIGACSPGMADRNRTLGIKAFERIRVPIPDRPVQDRVAKVLDGLTQGMRTAVQADERLAALRTSLLNAAFMGRL
ncbi:restriction endonuclease subunit S [Microbispora siamensis]